MIIDPVCMTCRHALDVWIDKQTGEETYKHTAAYKGPEHEAKPAPMAEFEKLNLVCDFCSSTDPIWRYECPDIVDTLEGRGVNLETHWGNSWSVCGPCAKLIEKKALEHLLTRVVRRAPVKWASETSMKLPLRPIYRTFLSSYTSRTRIG